MTLREKVAHRLYWIATGAEWSDEVQAYQVDFYLREADRILALVAEDRRELAGALRRYSFHENGCGWWSGAAGKCTCGLDAALRETEDPVEKS